MQLEAHVSEYAGFRQEINDVQRHRSYAVNFRWGDGTSRNYVSQYECSGTPSPLDEPSRKNNVPALIHPCHFAPTKT